VKSGLLLAVLSAVKRRNLIGVVPRAHLMSLRALGVVSASFVLAGSDMHRGLLMMFRRVLAFLRRLRVRFVNFLGHYVFAFVDVNRIRNERPQPRSLISLATLHPERRQER